MRRQLIPSIIAMVIFTLALGIAYPLLVTGVGQAAFNDKANGSIVSRGGKEVGSSLIAQSFLDAKGNPIRKYIQPRPSAANYDPSYSTGSNLGPTNPKLIAACLPVPKTDKSGNAVVDESGKPIYETNDDGSKVCDPNTVPQRAKVYRALNGLSAKVKVPVDAVIRLRPRPRHLDRQCPSAGQARGRRAGTQCGARPQAHR